MKLPDLKSLRIWGITDSTKYATTEVQNTQLSHFDLVGNSELSVTAYDLMENPELFADKSLSNSNIYTRPIPCRIDNPENLISLNNSGESLPEGLAFVFDKPDPQSGMSEATSDSEYTVVSTGGRNIQVSGVARGILRDFTIILQQCDPFETTFIDKETINISLANGDTQYFKFEFIQIPVEKIPKSTTRIKLLDYTNPPARSLKLVDEVGFYGGCNLVKLNPTEEGYTSNSFRVQNPCAYQNTCDAYQSLDANVFSNSQNAINLTYLYSINTDKYWFNNGYSTIASGQFPQKVFYPEGNELKTAKVTINTLAGNYIRTATLPTPGSQDYDQTWQGGKLKNLVAYVRGSGSATITFRGISRTVDGSTIGHGRRHVVDLNILPRVEGDTMYPITWTNSGNGGVVVYWFFNFEYEPHPWLVVGKNTISDGKFVYDPNEVMPGQLRNVKTNTIPNNEMIIPGYDIIHQPETILADGTGPWTLSGTERAVVINPNETNRSHLYKPVDLTDTEAPEYQYSFFKIGTPNPLGDGTFYNIPDGIETLIKPGQRLFGEAYFMPTCTFKLDVVEPTVKSFNLSSDISGSSYQISDFLDSDEDNKNLIDFTSISGGPTIVNIFAKTWQYKRPFNFYISKNSDTYQFPVDDPSHVFVDNPVAIYNIANTVHPGGDPDVIPAYGSYVWQSNSIMYVNKTGTKFKNGDWVQPVKENNMWIWKQHPGMKNSYRCQIYRVGWIGDWRDAHFWGTFDGKKFETYEEPSYVLDLGILKPGEKVRVYIEPAFFDLRRGGW
jgi:hypothetical protein